MPIYNYKAKDKTGNTINGAIDARDEHEAAAMIRESGCYPMDIRCAAGVAPSTVPKASTHSPFAGLWTGVNIRALSIFYRQFATLLGSGMSISESLNSVGRRTGGRLKSIILEMQEEAHLGKPLSETMKRYPAVFGALQISLIRAGEAGGLLQTMVERIADYLEYELKIRRMIAKMTIYPVIILIFALIAWIVVPHLPLLVKDGLGPFIEQAGPAFRVWFVWIVTIAIALKILFQFQMPKLIWDFIKTKPPVLGTTATKIAMSRFCRALAVLYAAGMSLGEALYVASDASGNLAISRGVKHAIPGVQSGGGLTASLEKTRMVMPMVLDMLSTGEKTGNMDASLDKVADYMDEETDATLHKMGIALFVLMILIAGVVVGKLIIDFWSQFYGAMTAPKE